MNKHIGTAMAGMAMAALAGCGGQTGNDTVDTAVNATLPNSAAPADPTAPARDGSVGEKPRPAVEAEAEAEPEPEPEPQAEPSADPSPEASAGPEDAASIPRRFRGRWGLVPADCDPRRDDNKGLMQVTAQKLSFYESRAIPSAVKRAGPDTIAVSLAFSGEGQTWTEAARFTLRQNGRILVRAGGEGGPLRYTRCEKP
jgi:hypothetical protein